MFQPETQNQMKTSQCRHKRNTKAPRWPQGLQNCQSHSNGFPKRMTWMKSQTIQWYNCVPRSQRGHEQSVEWILREHRQLNEIRDFYKLGPEISMKWQTPGTESKVKQGKWKIPQIKYTLDRVTVKVCLAWAAIGWLEFSVIQQT